MIVIYLLLLALQAWVAITLLRILNTMTDNATQNTNVLVPATFIDDVKTLVGNYNALGDKVDTLGTAFATTARTVTDSQGRISAAVEKLIERTGPVLGLDVSDLIEEIQTANAQAGDEVQKVNDLVTDTNSFGTQLTDFTQKVTQQAESATPAPPPIGPPTTPVGDPTTPDPTQNAGASGDSSAGDGASSTTAEGDADQSASTPPTPGDASATEAPATPETADQQG